MPNTQVIVSTVIAFLSPHLTTVSRDWNSPGRCAWPAPSPCTINGVIRNSNLLGMGKTETILNAYFKDLALNARHSQGNYQKLFVVVAVGRRNQKNGRERRRQTAVRMCWVSEDWDQTILMLKNSHQGNPGNSYGNFCFGPCNDTGISK